MSSSNAAAFPVTTVEDGPFCAATEIDSPHGSMSVRTRSTGRGIETMPPVPAIALIALLRNVTTFAASRNERAPAT